MRIVQNVRTGFGKCGFFPLPVTVEMGEGSFLLDNLPACFKRPPMRRRVLPSIRHVLIHPLETLLLLWVLAGGRLSADELNALLLERFYSVPHRLVSRVDPDGAVSVNRDWKEGADLPFYIEQQRYGVDLIYAGVRTGDEAMIRKGILLIDWGFSRQGPQGNFPGTGDPMHSTSFFVEAVSRSCRILDETGRDDLKENVVRWKKPLLAAGRWMSRPEEMERRKNVDLLPYTHRYYLRAAALIQAAEVTGDPSLALVGRSYLEQGLSRQEQDGTNPEKGGLDVSYQGVGVFYAQLLLPYLKEAEQRKRVLQMTERAWQPIFERIGEDGLPDTRDSKRAMELGRSGTPKRVAYRLIIPALAEQTRLSGDPKYAEVGKQMVQEIWPQPASSKETSPAGGR